MKIEIDFTDDEYERLELLLKYYETDSSNLLASLVFKEFLLRNPEIKKASQIEANEN